MSREEYGYSGLSLVSVNVHLCLCTYFMCVCAGGDGFVMKAAGSQRLKVPPGG